MRVRSIIILLFAIKPLQAGSEGVKKTVPIFGLCLQSQALRRVTNSGPLSLCIRRGCFAIRLCRVLSGVLRIRDSSGRGNRIEDAFAIKERNGTCLDLPLLVLDLPRGSDLGPQGKRLGLVSLLDLHGDGHQVGIGSPFASAAENKVFPTFTLQLPEHAHLIEMLGKQLGYLLHIPLPRGMLKDPDFFDNGAGIRVATPPERLVAASKPEVTSGAIDAGQVIHVGLSLGESRCPLDILIFDTVLRELEEDPLFPGQCQQDRQVGLGHTNDSEDLTASGLSELLGPTKAVVAQDMMLGSVKCNLLLRFFGETLPQSSRSESLNHLAKQDRGGLGCNFLRCT